MKFQNIRDDIDFEIENIRETNDISTWFKGTLTLGAGMIVGVLVWYVFCKILGF